MSDLLNGQKPPFKGSLKQGDMARIAEATGFSHDYVWRVLSAGSRKSKKIEAAAQQLLEQRKALKMAHRK